MSSVLLKNIGTIVSGDILNPLLEGDAIFVQEGKIQKVGREAALNVSDADVVIDCAQSQSCYHVGMRFIDDDAVGVIFPHAF